MKGMAIVLPLLVASAFAQQRTAAECAAIRQFNSLSRAEVRGMKAGELERECADPPSKPAPHKPAPKKTPKKLEKEK
jgi:hypothetical protein